MEILVVDNHSEDDSIGTLRNRLSHLSRVRIIEGRKNGGFGYGYNLGAKYAKGTYLMINNPAKILEKDAIEILRSKMQEDVNIGIIAPQLLHEDGSRRLSFRKFPTLKALIAKRSPLKSIFPKELSLYLQTHADPSIRQDTDWVAGGCFLIEKKFFEEIDGFDEDFFLFFEDIDLCRRSWEARKRVVYEPAARGMDRKNRLSDGNLLALVGSSIGRAHIASGIHYYKKWLGKPNPRKKPLLTSLKS